MFFFNVFEKSTLMLTKAAIKKEKNKKKKKNRQ